MSFSLSSYLLSISYCSNYFFQFSSSQLQYNTSVTPFQSPSVFKFILFIPNLFNLLLFHLNLSRFNLHIQSLPVQQSQSLPGQTSQPLPGQQSQYLPMQKSQSLPGQQSQYLPMQKSQTPLSPAWLGSLCFFSPAWLGSLCSSKTSLYTAAEPPRLLSIMSSSCPMMSEVVPVVPTARRRLTNHPSASSSLRLTSSPSLSLSPRGWECV